MSNKYPDRGDFLVPQELLDDYEWITDALIDAPMGHPCLLIYPPIASECTNCLFDIDSGHSANIYRTGGPIPFTNGTICPICGGIGQSLLPHEDTIRLRVYWSQKDWVKIQIPINLPNDSAQIIGYITDLTKLEQANEIVLESNIPNRRWTMKRSGQAVPWGLQRRYFVQFLSRMGDYGQ